MREVRYVRRMPPLIRAASILGMLFPLASMALLVGTAVKVVPSFLQWQTDPSHTVVMALDLGLLSSPCLFITIAYTFRVRRAGAGALPPDWWRSWVPWIVALTALPLCALALAVVLPQTSPLNFTPLMFSVLASLVNLAAWAMAVIRWYPRAR
jgi:hypothetical protein